MSDDFMDRVENAEARGSTPFWFPTTKTPTIVGVVEEYISTQTDYGLMEGCVVVIDQQVPVKDSSKENPRLADIGEPVAIWFKWKTLRTGWNAPYPAGGPPAIGERVGVKHLGKVKGGRGPTGEYTLFRVFVEGREGVAPAAEPVTQADVLAPEEEAYDPDLSGVHDDDELSDLPF